MSATRIRAVRLACGHVEATAAFYSDAFGCIDVARPDGVRALGLGAQYLEFVPATVEGGPVPPSRSSGFQHCAIVVSDIGEAMDRLHAVPGWTAISNGGPQRLPVASGGATAFKFRDPDGHPLELLEFPAGQMPAPWAAMGGGPFLGIDHSAITVASADRSIAFYEARGFRLLRRQWNRGAEQGRLDGVGGNAVVEVVALEPEGGAPPHLELLCYHVPETLAAPAPDGSRFATVLCLSGGAAHSRTIADPDGHRVSGIGFTGA